MKKPSKVNLDFYATFEWNLKGGYLSSLDWDSTSCVKTLKWPT